MSDGEQHNTNTKNNNKRVNSSSQRGNHRNQNTKQHDKILRKTETNKTRNFRRSRSCHHPPHTYVCVLPVHVVGRTCMHACMHTHTHIRFVSPPCGRLCSRASISTPHALAKTGEDHRPLTPSLAHALVHHSQALGGVHELLHLLRVALHQLHEVRAGQPVAVRVPLRDRRDLPNPSAERRARGQNGGDRMEGSQLSSCTTDMEHACSSTGTCPQHAA